MRRALLIVMVVVFVLGAVLGGRSLRPLVLAGFVGAGIIVLSTVLAPMLARRHYRKYKGIQVAFSAELLDEGLRVASPNGEGTLAWENILKWRQSDQFVLVYTMPRLFNILPKSVAEQGFDLQGLVERLNRHVGPEA